jgi:hypothetical protein
MNGKRTPSLGLALLGLIPGLLLAAPAQALFHIAHINEVMASYGGDDSVQFVEIVMLASGQNQVAHAVLAVFDSDGNYVTDWIVFPGNVANSGNGVAFVTGTASFETASGLTPDFTAAAADLPTTGGMVCYGGGGGILPQNPPNWDRTNLASYVDCLAYGNYSGPTKPTSGNPTPLLPVGHSLTRISDTDDNATDFDCGDPATPTNNAGHFAEMPATVVTCPEPAVALAQLAALGTLLRLRRRQRA